MLFNLFAAPAQVVEMARVVGSLVGGIPDWSVFLITALIGFLLGALGGLLGQSLSEIKLKNNTE